MYQQTKTRAFRRNTRIKQETL